MILAYLGSGVALAAVMAALLAGLGSRIDVRSEWRVGRSDLGVNAKRIREFLRQLAAGKPG